MKLPVLILILIYTFLASCNEYFYRKTVSVQFLTGELQFEPSAPSLQGDLVYDIQNNQKEDLKEIFLISHESVIIQQIFYNSDSIRHESGSGYGYGIYRVRIPVLSPGAQARIRVRFLIEGPYLQNRFQLTGEGVFMDAKNVWIPVPFAEIPRFHYSIRIRTPESHIPVLSARLTGETTSQGIRTTTWESEMNDIFLSGNMFIGRFKRHQKGSLYFYTLSDIDPQNLFQTAEMTAGIMKEQVGFYPLNQLHFIDRVYQYDDMKEQIDGEFLANTILLSPALLRSPSIYSQPLLQNSPVPFVPEDSGWRLFEAVAHEMAHAYVHGILKFDEDSFIEQESLTEFTALCVIQLKNRQVYDKFIAGNRISLINLSSSRNRENILWKYLFGVNCLDSAFYHKPAQFFSFLKLLMDKYSYTQIRISELVATSLEINRSLMNRLDPSTTAPAKYLSLVHSPALELWGRYTLYNAFITDQPPASKEWPSDPRKKYITLSSDYPVDSDMLLSILQSSNNIATNLLRLGQNSDTPWTIHTEDTAVILDSPFSSVESRLGDNRFSFEPFFMEDTIASNLNLFYNRQQPQPPYGISDIKTANPSAWKPVSQDRELSIRKNSNITILVDRIWISDREIYIEAYKAFDGVPFSYIIVRAEKNKGQILFTAVMDPRMP